MACVVLNNILTKFDKYDTELMDPAAQARIQRIQQLAAQPTRNNGHINEQLMEPEDIEDQVDFDDWRALQRYDAAMAISKGQGSRQIFPMNTGSIDK